MTYQVDMYVLFLKLFRCYQFFGVFFLSLVWVTMTGHIQLEVACPSSSMTVVLLVLSMVYSVFLLIIILITTPWTFLYTRGFLKKVLNSNADTQFSDQEQSDYNRRIRSLVGIFGALLIVNVFSWISYVFPPVFYALIGD